MKTTTPISVLAIGAAVASIAIIIAACSSASDDAAPTHAITPAPSGTSSGTTTSSGSSNGGLDATSEADPSCTTDAGCFSCEPSTLVEFYNECTEGQCAPFDNAARLPLYEPGKPLPAVP